MSTETLSILAEYPAVLVLEIPATMDIQLTNDKGYARTAPFAIYLKSFTRDRYEFIRSFTIGCDGDNPENVWAYGNGSMLTAEERRQETAFGVELGQVIRVEGREFRVEPDHNHNIKLTEV